MSYAKRAAPVLALAAVLIFWEAAVRLFQIPLYVLPSPTEVLNALISDRLTRFSHSVRLFWAWAFLWFWQLFWESLWTPSPPSGR